MTLRQLRGFWGVTVYCCIWIPGYGKLAQPLYKFIAKLSKPKLRNWFGLQKLKRLLRFFRLLSCRLQLWACPQCQNLICLSLKEKVWPWEFWHNTEGLSSNLLLISRGWPHCLTVIGAEALLAPEALKIINGWNLTVLTSHDVSGILNSKVNIWMTDFLNISHCC